MLSVVLLNYSRPSNIKDFIIPSLQKYGIVNEIIISHGKQESVFKSKHNKVTNLYHQGSMNKEFGLTLRFVSGAEAKNDYVMIMDDDILPSEQTVQNLYDKVKKREGIYGLYGRYLDENMGYNKTNAFGKVPIVLTRCLICTKDMCQYFVDNFRDYETEKIRNSKPYWNGEDILFSLLSIKKYNRLPEAFDYDHYNTLSDYLTFGNAISSGVEHDNYRKELTKDFVSKLSIENEIKKTEIKKEKSQLGYFYENSSLQPIVLTSVFVAILIMVIKINPITKR